MTRPTLNILGLPGFVHGCDYNPDQWLHAPSVIDEDFRLFPDAGIGVVSLNIFGWARLEPEEGRYDFAWLDDIFDRVERAGMKVFLSTPSAAAPNWLTHRYPEVLRVNERGQRRQPGMRMNFCPTSRIYREKVAALNHALSARYGRRPSLALWHISNEYHGVCYCEECEASFRQWLQGKYGTLDALNAAWWSAFWSRTCTAWEQIRAPRPEGEGTSIHGLCLDWRRFNSALWADFIAAEVAAIRAGGSTVPTATNLHPGGLHIDPWVMTAPTDIISWDAYPQYHDTAKPWSVAWNAIVYQSFIQQLCAAIRPDRPWLLMETTPSSANWMDVPKLKAPGLHRLSVLQSIAHGADSALYFQWRAGRGGEEKFHGAVIENNGGPDSRVFGDVRSVTEAFAQIAPVAGSLTSAEVAVGFDWDNWWLQSEILSHGSRGRSHYPWEQLDLYREHWENAVPCAVVDPSAKVTDLSRYRLLILPQHYALRPGFVEKITAWVEAGGVLLTGLLSGWVDENDLIFPGGMDAGWRRLVGLRREELDHIYPDEKNRFVFASDNVLGLAGEYSAVTKLELNHLESAVALASYGDNFYAGRPALTVNAVGKGFVYYQAARSEQSLRTALLAALWKRHGIKPLLPAGSIPPGVTVQRRLATDGREFWFFLNFRAEPQRVRLHDCTGHDLLTGRACAGQLDLAGFGVAVLSIAPPDK